MELPDGISQEKLTMLREETKDLAKAMNQVYNSMVFSCQKRCLFANLGTPLPAAEI